MKTGDQFYMALFLQVTAGVVASHPNGPEGEESLYVLIKRVTDDIYHEHLLDQTVSEVPKTPTLIHMARGN